MSKTWEEMSSDEKIEDLRTDIKSIFYAINEIRDGQNNLLSRINQLGRLVNEASKDIDKLKGK